MRHGRSSLALVAAGVVVFRPLLAQAPQDITEGGAAFLLIAVGARATALGQAATADAGTSEAAFWNPAGLATLSRNELAIHHATTFVSDNTVIAAYLASSLVGVLGVSAYLVDYGAQDIVPGPGQPPTGRLTPRNLELLASYATSLGGPVAFGVTYKLIQLRNDCSGDCGGFRSITGTTHAVDVGVQYGTQGPTGTRLGAALRHAGFDLQLDNANQADPLPTRVAFGAVYGVRLPTSPTAETTFARILVDVENECCARADPDLRVGGELGYGDVLRLRAGYAFLHTDARGPSLGAGLRFGRLGVDFGRIFYDSGSFDEPVYLSMRVTL